MLVSFMAFLMILGGERLTTPLLCPGGKSDSSPAIHCWGEEACGMSAVGTAEERGSVIGCFSRPSSD